MNDRDHPDEPDAEYRLHCLAQSGNAYKVALALELAGARWTPLWVDFFNGATRAAEFRAKNVMAEVPVLEHAGRTLTQSGAILDYLTTTLGRFGWTDDDERREMLRWLLWDNHKLTSPIATYRWMLNFQPEDKRDPAVLAFLRSRMTGALKTLEAHLADRAYAVGERLTIADLSMVGYLYFQQEYGVDWNDYPAIGAWTARIAAEPGWRHPYDLMPGHPLPTRSA
jgi:glutathione S-transferase